MEKTIFKSPFFSEKIRFVAFYGLFLSLSTQMLYSHLALFLKFDCNSSDAQIAAIDGVVEFLSYITRIFSGVISDYLYDRKLLLIIGCTIAIMVKPIFASAHSVLEVVCSEIVERLGSGLQASPRDAFIADLSPKFKLGASFGFCKSLKTIGGVLGSLLALGIIWFSSNNYRLLFVLSSIPALFALFCVLKIKNSAKLRYKIKKFDNPFQRKYLKSMNADFWKLMLMAFVCESGHIGDSLLTLQSTQFFSQTLAGMTSVFAAIGQILFSYFMGIASDRINKMHLLKINLFLILISYLMVCFGASGIAFLICVSILSGQYAAMQLLFLSMISTRVSINLRGTAIGVFYCVIGFAYMLATNICGFLCQNFGYGSVFFYVSFISFIAIVMLFCLSKLHKTQGSEITFI